MNSTSDAAPRMRTRRLERCPGCGLPHDLCLCAELPKISLPTRVVLLVHNVEVHRSTNSGRLLLQILEGSQQHIRGARGGDAARVPDGTRLVLFPAPGARLLTPDETRPVVLLVPDGNWSQARRMPRREQSARGSELVHLPDGGAPSRYRLRQTNRPGAVSTFEAVARALAILEGPEVERDLMVVFDEFVRRSLLVRASRRTPP